MNYQSQIDNLERQKKRVINQADADLSIKTIKSDKNGKKRNNFITKITSLLYRIIAMIENWVQRDQEIIECQKNEIKEFLINNK